MSIEPSQEKSIIYSSYGYIRVNKKDLEENNEMIGFQLESGSLYGTINV